MSSSLFDRLLSLGKTSSSYRGRKRRRRVIAKLELSEWFDRSWYLESYPDVRDSGIDPALHYLESGWREGRDPGPDFCTTAYLKSNSDVAALGVNPLLHYIEHGQAEGRGALHQAGPLRDIFNPTERFGPAAACVQFPIPAADVGPWLRAGRVRDPGRRTVEIGGLVIATAEGPERRMVEHALTHLAGLSGEDRLAPTGSAVSAGRALEMLDAWHPSDGIFRTRWVAPKSGPVVVRAVQHVQAEPTLVGESCIRVDLDLFDMKLANPYFPVLFLFTTPTGELVGLRHLAFPSLCRGGSHYPELLASMQRAPCRIDISSVDASFAEALIALRAGKARPLAAEIAVAHGSGDGTGALFQSDVQTWLSGVMKIPVRALDRGAADSASGYLAAAVHVEAGSERKDGTAKLRVTDDMIPSISVLVAGAGEGQIFEEVAGSIIVASEDSSTVSSWVHVPFATPAADFGCSNEALASLIPIEGKSGLPSEIPLLAIRRPQPRGNLEAELLAGRSTEDHVVPEVARSITWLVWPEHWSEPDLTQSMEAVAQQRSTASSILFVGQPADSTREIAARLFGGRVQIVPSAPRAQPTLIGGLCGYLGPGIILHDRSTIERLAPLLDRPGVLTVTALRVAAERRGKGAVVAIADRDPIRDARLLPGAVVPIREPADDFWIARSEAVARWLDGLPDNEGEGRHVCSTFVSVSTLAAGVVTEQPLTIPRNAQDRAVTIERLAG